MVRIWYIKHGYNTGHNTFIYGSGQPYIYNHGHNMVNYNMVITLVTTLVYIWLWPTLYIYGYGHNMVNYNMVIILVISLLYILFWPTLVSRRHRVRVQMILAGEPASKCL
jgi:ABC-type transport system involved in Fe-S cluster assembly fused permease/ATPase subunit